MDELPAKVKERLAQLTGLEPDEALARNRRASRRRDAVVPEIQPDETVPDWARPSGPAEAIVVAMHERRVHEPWPGVDEVVAAVFATPLAAAEDEQ